LIINQTRQEFSMIIFLIDNLLIFLSDSLGFYFLCYSILIYKLQHFFIFDCYFFLKIRDRSFGRFLGFKTVLRRVKLFEFVNVVCLCATRCHSFDEQAIHFLFMFLFSGIFYEFIFVLQLMHNLCSGRLTIWGLSGNILSQIIRQDQLTNYLLTFFLNLLENIFHV